MFFFNSTTVLVFLFGAYLAHLADILAEAWHKEGPVFGKGAFLPFVKSITSSKTWFLLGRKRSLFRWVIPEMLACGGLTVAFYFHFGTGFLFWLMEYLLFTFAVSLISDLQWREIPHEINYLTAILAIFLVIIGKNQFGNVLLGTIPALILLVFGMVMYFIRPQNGLGFGGGDLRFIFSMGLLMGLSFAILLLTTGCFFSVLLALPSLVQDIRYKRTTYVPMMAGFSLSYLLLLFTHYLADTEDDMFPMLDVFSITSRF